MISSCLSSFAGAMCFCLKANINYSSGINAWIWTCCCLNSCLCFGCAVTNWLLDHASTWFLIMLIQIGDWWWVYSAHFTEPCTNCVFKKILVFINHGWFDHMPCSFPQSPQEGEQVAVPTYHPRSSRPPCEWGWTRGRGGRTSTAYAIKTNMNRDIWYGLHGDWSGC